MSVNFDSAFMRSKAIGKLNNAEFRVYFVLSQHCVELRSSRIAAPSFTQLHSAIAPECGGISIGMFRKSLLSLESAGFLKISPNGRVKIFDLLGVRESYPDVAWFDRPVLILEPAVDCRPEAVGVSSSLPAHDSSIRNHQSSLLAAPPDAGRQTNMGEGSVGNAPILDPSTDTVLVGVTQELPSSLEDARLEPWRSQGSGLLHARGHDNVIGSSSNSSAQANPTSATTVTLQGDTGYVLCGENPSSSSSSASKENSDLPASQNPSLPLSPFRGILGTTSVDLCDLCGKTPPLGSLPIINHQSAFINARKASLPLATQKALLDDLRKRTAAVLARVHRDFPQSRPVRWGSQDPSSPFDEENADAPGLASDASCPETPDLSASQNASPPLRTSVDLCVLRGKNPSLGFSPASSRDEAPILDLATVDADLLEIPTGQYAIHLRNCGKLPPLSSSPTNPSSLD